MEVFIKRSKCDKFAGGHTDSWGIWYRLAAMLGYMVQLSRAPGLLFRFSDGYPLTGVIILFHCYVLPSQDQVSTLPHMRVTVTGWGPHNWGVAWITRLPHQDIGSLGELCLHVTFVLLVLLSSLCHSH
jgi:hypothetical protein